MRIVQVDAPLEKVITAIQESEGGYKYREGMNFRVEQQGEGFRITPAGDDYETWESLSALLNSKDSPIAVANLQEKPKQKVKG